jgi:virginiamycin A acetyltransferase
MWLKKYIRRILLRYKKNIYLDNKSDLNYSVVNNGGKSQDHSEILDSKCHFIEMGEGCNISEARCYGNIILGKYVSITGPGAVIKSLKSKITIGSFSSIGQNVCIIDFNHSFERISSSFINHIIFKESFEKDLSTEGEVIIEEDVWIGSNTIVLPGVRIGRGSIIGGGSVVTKDVPNYAVAYGNPAKIKGQRFSIETIEYLENLKWWEWDKNKIYKNRELFNIDVNKNSVSELKSIFR